MVLRESPEGVLGVDGEIVVERELARPFSVEQVGKPERWFALRWRRQS